MEQYRFLSCPVCGVAAHTIEQNVATLSDFALGKLQTSASYIEDATAEVALEHAASRPSISD